MRILFLLIFGLWCAGLSAQKLNLSGLWKGIITQNEGGYKPKYEFEIFLHQKGNQLHGRSYVYVDNIYAIVELQGEIHGNEVILQETRIVDSRKIPGLEWCVKAYKLTYSAPNRTPTLSGSWTGHTQGIPCVPGSVVLSRKAARA